MFPINGIFVRTQSDSFCKQGLGMKKIVFFKYSLLMLFMTLRFFAIGNVCMAYILIDTINTTRCIETVFLILLLLYV